MKIETNLNNKQIAQIIDEWFRNTNTLHPRFWEVNLVAKTIKNNLIKVNRWPRKKRNNNKISQIIKLDIAPQPVKIEQIKLNDF